MVDCDAYGLKIMSIPQGEICGNFVELPAGETEETVGAQPCLARNPLSCMYDLPGDISRFAVKEGGGVAVT